MTKVEKKEIRRKLRESAEWPDECSCGKRSDQDPQVGKISYFYKYDFHNETPLEAERMKCLNCGKSYVLIGGYTIVMA